MAETLYMVMGRQKQRWHSVLSPTSALHQARQGMYATNQSDQYDRLVLISHAVGSSQWVTLECALPMAVTPFAQLLGDMNTHAANNNPPNLPDQAFLVGHPQQMMIPLGLALVLATIQMDVVLLGCVAACATLDAAYLLACSRAKTPLSMLQTRHHDAFRNWAYAFLCGICLMMLVEPFMGLS